MNRSSISVGSDLYQELGTRTRFQNAFYPVPNPGNWYPFFTLITGETDENLATCSFCCEMQI